VHDGVEVQVEVAAGVGDEVSASIARPSAASSAAWRAWLSR
jgi:hypothetical protein